MFFESGLATSVYPNRGMPGYLNLCRGWHRHGSVNVTRLVGSWCIGASTRFVDCAFAERCMRRNVSPARHPKCHYCFEDHTLTYSIPRNHMHEQTPSGVISTRCCHGSWYSNATTVESVAYLHGRPTLAIRVWHTKIVTRNGTVASRNSIRLL